MCHVKHCFAPQKVAKRLLYSSILCYNNLVKILHKEKRNKHGLVWRISILSYLPFGINGRTGAEWLWRGCPQASHTAPMDWPHKRNRMQCNLHRTAFWIRWTWLWNNGLPNTGQTSRRQWRFKRICPYMSRKRSAGYLWRCFQSHRKRFFCFQRPAEKPWEFTVQRLVLQCKFWWK